MSTDDRPGGRGGGARRASAHNPVKATSSNYGASGATRHGRTVAKGCFEEATRAARSRYCRDDKSRLPLSCLESNAPSRSVDGDDLVGADAGLDFGALAI